MQLNKIPSGFFDLTSAVKRQHGVPLTPVSAKKDEPWRIGDLTSAIELSVAWWCSLIALITLHKTRIELLQLRAEARRSAQ